MTRDTFSRSNSRIISGILILALLLLPTLGLAQTHNLDGGGGSGGGGGGGGLSPNSNTATAVTISSITPSSGPSGTIVTISGSGFTSTNNTVKFNSLTAVTADSSNGQTITFTVPTTLANCSPTGGCTNSYIPVTNGVYAVTVTNSRGTSNTQNFTVIGNDDSTVGPPAATSTTPTQPVHICTTSSNCIQGAKVPFGGPGVNAKVTLDGNKSTTTESFAFENLSSGLHTLTVEAPVDWLVGYTVCINSVSCHDDMPIQGDTVSIKFQTNSNPPSVKNGVVSVPAGSYVDVYWHFSQNFDDFGSAPDDLNSHTGDGSQPNGPTPGSSQADAYTSGNVSSGGGASITGAAANALGCALSQILNGTIRQAISNSVKTVVNKVVSTVGNADKVGITSQPQVVVSDNFNTTRQNSDVNTSARTGTTILGAIAAPSWNAIAYCLQNAIIQYIHQATLQWVNTAFNGNPIFVQNLGGYLASIGDQATLNFFNQISRLNPYSPFGPSVNQAVIQSYGSTYAQQSQYTLGNTLPYGADRTFVQPGGFVNASQSIGGSLAANPNLPPGGISPGVQGQLPNQGNRVGGIWASYYSLIQPQNHPTGEYLITLQSSHNVSTAQQAIAEKNVSNGGGTLPATAKNQGTPSNVGANPVGTKTPPGQVPVARATPVLIGGQPVYRGQWVNDPSQTKITVPGRTLADTAQQVINLPYLRQIAQTTFDQALTALINTLINVALNKIFSGH